MASWTSTAAAASAARPACRPARMPPSTPTPSPGRRPSATTVPTGWRSGSSRPASSSARCRPSSRAISTIPRRRSPGSSPRSRPKSGSRSTGLSPSSSTSGPRRPRSRPMQERSGGYAFAQVSRIPDPGTCNVAVNGGAAAAVEQPEVDLLRLARTVYDVAHPERPWGWRVSTYLWTKSVAAGVFLVSALALMGGLASGGAVTGLAAPLIGLLFLALTTTLLVFDLKRPERCLSLLFKPNWRSWLVWGGWILVAFGAAGGLWLLAGWTGHAMALRMLAWPMVPLAAAAAGYSAFLFGQAEGRDFWQSPLLLPHLLVAALVAGTATLLLAARVVDGPARVTEGLGLALWLGLGASAVVLAAELFSSHPTQDGARAARLLTHGRLRLPLWAGVALGGIVLPGILLLTPALPAASVTAALLALGGLWLWEELWVRAGQAIPLS